MIFIDTGAFVARSLPRDQHHEAATQYWREIEQRKLRCCTSSFVLDETFTLLGRLAGNRFAAQRARNIYASRTLSILRPDAKTEARALEHFTKYADQGISFTDAISFALMKQARVRNAFTFDHHFAIAGFTLNP